VAAAEQGGDVCVGLGEIEGEASVAVDAASEEGTATGRGVSDAEAEVYPLCEEV